MTTGRQLPYWRFTRNLRLADTHRRRYCFVGDLIFKKGETLEQYLERHELGSDCKYPISTYSFIEDGEYFSHGDIGWWGVSSNDKPDDVWRQATQDFISRIPEDNFLVLVDCHI